MNGSRRPGRYGRESDRPPSSCDAKLVAQATHNPPRLAQPDSTSRAGFVCGRRSPGRRVWTPVGRGDPPHDAPAGRRSQHSPDRAPPPADTAAPRPARTQHRHWRPRVPPAALSACMLQCERSLNGTLGT
jgi:hypothetical protein